MVGKVAIKLISSFSRNIETIFFMLLYREITARVIKHFPDREEEILKHFGREGARRSCARHQTVMKFAPEVTEPGKVKELVGFLWLVAFGRSPEFEYSIEHKEDYFIVTLSIDECPVCSGLPRKDLKAGELEIFKTKDDGYACILTGLIEGASKFLLDLHGRTEQIKIVESKCILNGQEKMEIKVSFGKNING